MRASMVLRVGAASTLAASALLVSGGPSQAASCVEYHLSENNRAVVVDNTCSETRRVKIIWNNATDSACTQLAAYDGQLIDSRGYPAAFDRLTSC